uniref:Uncharacterized protein n=1 Tax=Crocodylus porosus TaxID=8502 RepID=A0A7M4ETE1_CROPO
TSQAMLCFCLFQLTKKRSFHENMFLSLVNQIGIDLNLSHCWICSHVPIYSTGGIPMILVPLNATQMLAPYYTDFHGNKTWQNVSCNQFDYVRLAYATPGKFCWTCNVSHVVVGVSKCKVEFQINGAWFSNGSWISNYFSAGQFSGYYLQWMMSPHCDIGGYTALAGHYFVYGDKAYKNLPSGWRGTCYVYTVYPVFTIKSHLPNGKIRNVHEITENQRFGGIMFPSYGAGLAMSEIKKLAASLEKIANATADNFDKTNTEMKKIRQMTLQNRLALDYILASKGEICWDFVVPNRYMYLIKMNKLSQE